jgi:hypothetical protein
MAGSKGMSSMSAVRLTSGWLGLTRLLLMACAPTPGWAQDGTDLAKATQNPVGDLDPRAASEQHQLELR